MVRVLDDVDRWWRAANYLSVGQIYLRDNPLLERELTIGDVKPRLLGHWGTCPGINLVWAHLNRILAEREHRTLFVCGPGHGGPAVLANAWLDGTYSELFADVTQDVMGMQRLFAQFSSPGGVPSHAAAETPGSIHEGGELGYSLAHAHGAAFDARGELVVCLIGDGEAETGPLSGSWQSIHFTDPSRDGVVLPILHLNGYKIANPTVLARLPESQLRSLLNGYGHEPWFVAGDHPADVHAQLAGALDEITARHDVLSEVSTRAPGTAVKWPMLVLRTPKGWTGPESIDGLAVEGHFRSHQVPIGHDLGASRLLAALETWMRSYRPEELFDDLGAPVVGIRSLRPRADLRMSANARANSTSESIDLHLPPLNDHTIQIGGDETSNGDGVELVSASAMKAAGGYLRDVIRSNPTNFRLFGPDEVASNRLSAVFDVTDRAWGLGTRDTDVHLEDDDAEVPGRVMEVLSEHLCQGWLEGYTLTGRHGVFTTYEAFVHIADSMFNQHAKWLQTAAGVPWRLPEPSFNYLLSSHVWRQDHNGFSHQDPGFLDVVANKCPDVARIYLPPDANSLIAVLDRCLRSRGRINVVVAGKQPEVQYLTASEAVEQLAAGASIWEWAGNEAERSLTRPRDRRPAPDVVLGCAGDVPTMETVAAAQLLRSQTDLTVRVVNVVDLFAMQPADRHPHGLDHDAYDRMFPPGVPTIFAFHGYPSLVHRLAYKREHHRDLHVHGFSDQGTTTTPFDMAVRNEIDRFHLAIDAVERQPPDRRAAEAGAVEQWTRHLLEHHDHVRRAGDDLELVTDTRFSRSDLAP